MKRFIIMMVLVLVPALAVAATGRDSGSKKLNRYLEQISVDVHDGSLDRSALKSHIEQSFGVKGDAYLQIERAKLDPSEAYIIGLIHKATNANVSKIISRYGRGKKSWSDVIYYFGTSPNELERMQVADSKDWKRERSKVRTAERSTVAKSSSTKQPVISKQPVITTKTAAKKLAPKTLTMNSEDQEWECLCRAK